MGSTDCERHRLPEISEILLFIGRVAALALLVVAGPVNAQVLPFRGVLEFSHESSQQPTLIVSSSNGGPAYALTLKAEKDVKGNVVLVDLVMRPATTSVGTLNLLEPPGTWHGYQQFMFAGSDYKNGPEHSTYGATRNFALKDRKLAVKTTVKAADVEAEDEPDMPDSYRFKKLILEIDVSNLD